MNKPPEGEKPAAKKPRAPRKSKTYPKKAEGGLGIAGNPEKYAQAHEVAKEAQEKEQENKYAPKEKIGTPTLGRSPNYVTKVGLGGLKVIHNGRDPGAYS